MKIKGINKKLITSIRYSFLKFRIKFLYRFKLRNRNKLINQLLNPTNLILLQTDCSDSVLLLRLKNRSFKCNVIEEVRNIDKVFARKFRKEMRMKYLDIDFVFKYIAEECSTYFSEYQILDKRDITYSNISKKEISYLLI